MQRNMSLHVGSRWYRAPEISLVEKQYDFSSDLWSLGCIIHELIQYLQYNRGEQNFRKEFQRIRYLYQGNSCFPLSPCDKNDDDKDKKDKTDKDNDEKVHVISKDDQNLVILKDLGVQTEIDLSFLTSKHAINYVRELEQSLYGNNVGKMKRISPIEKRADIMTQKLTPGAEEITDIMKNFLQLNPFLRWSAYECIMKCKIFDDVRVRTRELCLKKLHDISLRGYQQKA
jgi:serine/threonine protein kinase